MGKEHKTQWKPYRWCLSTKCQTNSKYFDLVGKCIVDEDLNEVYRIINVFEHGKYPGTFFFGYANVNAVDVVENMEYSTCIEILEEDGFRIQK